MSSFGNQVFESHRLIQEGSEGTRPPNSSTRLVTNIKSLSEWLELMTSLLTYQVEVPKWGRSRHWTTHLLSTLYELLIRKKVINFLIFLCVKNRFLLFLWNFFYLRKNVNILLDVCLHSSKNFNYSKTWNECEWIICRI